MWKIRAALSAAPGKRQIDKEVWARLPYIQWYIITSYCFSHSDSQTHLSGCRADKTKMSMMTSRLSSGIGYWADSSLRSWTKAWQRVASYSGLDYGNHKKERKTKCCTSSKYAPNVQKGPTMWHIIKRPLINGMHLHGLNIWIHFFYFSTLGAFKAPIRFSFCSHLYQLHCCAGEITAVNKQSWVTTTQDRGSVSEP